MINKSRNVNNRVTPSAVLSVILKYHPPNINVIKYGFIACNHDLYKKLKYTHYTYIQLERSGAKICSDNTNAKFFQCSIYVQM